MDQMTNKRIKLIKGDITKIEVDVVVNAANKSLLGGGGVDGAIHRAGGKAILDECIEIRKWQGGCLTGQAVITTAGDLPAEFVIHTVGPVWHGGTDGEDELLRSSYRNSLLLAVENNVTTIAFPNISTGAYRFPKEQAAQIAIDEVQKFLQQNQTVRKIIFVCFDDENYQIYESCLENK